MSGASGQHPTASYELYRRSSIGAALLEVLDELITSEHMTPQLAMKTLAQFDKSMFAALNAHVNFKTSMKGRLAHYRFVDEVWTFEVRDAQIKLEMADAIDTFDVPKLKIVACKAVENK